MYSISFPTTEQMALSAVTDAYGKGSDHAERMRGCSKVVQLMLRTWSGEFVWSTFRSLTHSPQGLMYFCMDDMRAIRSLIDTLRIPSLDTRVRILLCLTPSISKSRDFQEIILDMFFELLNLKTPEWYQTFIDGRRLTSEY